MGLTNIRLPFAGRSSLFRFIEDEKKFLNTDTRPLMSNTSAAMLSLAELIRFVKMSGWNGLAYSFVHFFKVVRAWEGTQDHLIQLFSLALQLSYTGSPIYMLLT